MTVEPWGHGVTGYRIDFAKVETVGPQDLLDSIDLLLCNQIKGEDLLVYCYDIRYFKGEIQVASTKTGPGREGPARFTGNR